MEKSRTELTEDQARTPGAWNLGELRARLGNPSEELQPPHPSPRPQSMWTPPRPRPPPPPPPRPQPPPPEHVEVPRPGFSLASSAERDLLSAAGSLGAQVTFLGPPGKQGRGPQPWMFAPNTRLLEPELTAGSRLVSQRLLPDPAFLPFCFSFCY